MIISLQIVKVDFESLIVEVDPSSSSSGSSELEVKVNGAHQHIPENGVVQLGVRCTIHKEGDMIHIYSRTLGIKVATNCEDIHIEASNFLVKMLTKWYQSYF